MEDNRSLSWHQWPADAQHYDHRITQISVAEERCFHSEIKANITFTGGKFEQFNQQVNMKVLFHIYQVHRSPHLKKHNEKKRLHWSNLWAQVTGQIKLVSDWLKDKGSSAVTKPRSDQNSIWQQSPQTLWNASVDCKCPHSSKTGIAAVIYFQQLLFSSLVNCKLFCPPVCVWCIASGCAVGLATCP